MRIRKRYQNPLPPPDLSSQNPPSAAAAAAAVAPPVAAAGGAAGGKEGEALAAEAAEAEAARVAGGGWGGGGGRGTLHPNGRSTNPTPCLPFLPQPSAAAAAGGERGDLHPPGSPLLVRDVGFARGHGREVSKREQDDGENGEDGDAYGGDNAPVPKSFGAEASEVSGGHGGGRKVLPSGAAAVLAAAEAIVRWGVDEEGKFPLKKRRGSGYHSRGRSFGLEAEEEGKNVVTKREMKQRPRPSKTRRRRAAASSFAPMAATGIVLTSAGTGNGGAPTDTAGDGTGGTDKCDDMVVKEEGGDMVSAAASLVDVNRGVGNGKKRRSPAVLMEGSRCSRVNGRGWRCCQQTLVGYSLCEHHLGKGRLRSVSSVRCNGRARKKEDVGDHLGAAAPPLPSPLRQQQGQVLSADGEGGEEEDQKPGKPRRNRIGMVKARSISSLLHQPDHPTTATVAAAPEEPIFPSPSPVNSSYAPSNSCSSTILCL